MASSAGTPTEEAVWKRLERDQLGVTFAFRRRVLGYVAEFFCDSAKLVVELEGGQADKKGGTQGSVKGRAQKWRGLVVLRLPSEMTVDEMVERIDRKLTFLQVERHLSGGEPAPDKASHAA